MFDILSFDIFDPNNSVHLDELEEKADALTIEQLQFIYDIIDSDIVKESHQTYHTYNVRDVFLVDKLEKKLKLISLAILMTYDAGVNFADTFGTVRVWDMIIHDYLMKRQMVVPFSNSCDEDFKIEGGHVKDPANGLYEWVVSVDLKSSYPHQIMQYNIGPETFVDMIPGFRANRFVPGDFDMSVLTENGKYCIAANGCRFRKDRKSFWSALMEENFNKRKVYKAKMMDAERLLNDIDIELARRAK
jgi:DNA polymerase elongation subunit (family B)